MAGRGGGRVAAPRRVRVARLLMLLLGGKERERERFEFI